MGPTRHMCVLFAAVLIAGCGGGGGGGGGGADPASSPPPAPTNNFTATALKVVTANPRIGYPLAVSVSITAKARADDVTVSLFAVEKNPNLAVVTRQFPLGTETLARVDAGNGSYPMTVNVPSTVELPGSYYLAAIVNPVGAIAESDDSDNIASIEATLAVPSVPNILIKEAVLDRSVLEVRTTSYESQVTGAADNVYNADAGGTITVGVDGLEVGQTIDLEGFAKLRIRRSDRGTSHDVPLYLWRSDAGRYTRAFGIDPSVPQCNTFGCTAVAGLPEWLPLGRFQPQLVQTTGEEVALQDVSRDSTHLSFYFPGKLGRELEIAMRQQFVTLSSPAFPPPDLTPEAIQTLRGFLFGLPFSGIRDDESAAMAVMSFAICVQIRSADASVADRVPDDNEVCTPLAIMLPAVVQPPPAPQIPPAFTPRFPNVAHPIIAGAPFRAKGGGSAFGYGLEFAASSSADHHGVTVNMGGPLTVTLFGATSEFMKAVVTARLIPEASDYAHRPPNEKSGFKTELRFAGALISALDLPPASSPKLSVTFSKEKSKDTPPIWVGPVPITGSASVGGNIGIEYQFVFTSDPTAVAPEPKYALGLTAGPFVSLEAGLSASVGNPAFSVGVEGVLALIDERLTFSIGSQIEIVDAGFVSGISEFVINQSPKVINDLTGPKGALNLYAKYSVPSVRKCSWGFVTGLCPTVSTLKATKEIWSSKALFRYRDVLFEDQNMKLNVVVMQGKPPAYYSP